MSSVAVVANQNKRVGGLPELRRILEREGVSNPMWHEVQKSREAPKRVRQALDSGADLVFVWGGDGMVQHCVGALANTKAALAVVPAGTANLFAANLRIPDDIAQAVALGLRGRRKKFDIGRMNGESFAVFAGAGFTGAAGRMGAAGDTGSISIFGTVTTGLRSIPDCAVASCRVRIGSSGKSDRRLRSRSAACSNSSCWMSLTALSRPLS